MRTLPCLLSLLLTLACTAQKPPAGEPTKAAPATGEPARAAAPADPDEAVRKTAVPAGETPAPAGEETPAAPAENRPAAPAVETPAAAVAPEPPPVQAPTAAPIRVTVAFAVQDLTPDKAKQLSLALAEQAGVIAAKVTEEGMFAVTVDEARAGAQTLLPLLQRVDPAIRAVSVTRDAGATPPPGHDCGGCPLKDQCGGAH